MKLQDVSFALVVVCLLSSLPATSACAAAPPLLDHRERIALNAVDTRTDDNDGDGDGVFGDHLNLFNRVGTQVGTFDVVGLPTAPDGAVPGVLTFVASFADGAVMGQGILQFTEEGPPPPAIMAVVGGTGRYRRVGGYARVVPKESGARIVLHLLP
jgi:hypothetical protein